MLFTQLLRRFSETRRFGRLSCRRDGAQAGYLTQPPRSGRREQSHVVQGASAITRGSNAGWEIPDTKSVVCPDADAVEIGVTTAQGLVT